MTSLSTRNEDAMVALARRLARIERAIGDLGGEDGFGFSSMELSDGLATYYDEDGNIRLLIGIHDDGRFAIKYKGGTPPPKPTAPDCTPVLAGVLVYYDGTYEDDKDVPSDFAYYEVHASPTPGFTADDTTMVGTMYSPDGGTFVHGVATRHTLNYYAIVAVDWADNHSDKSDEVACKSGGIVGYQDYATATADGGTCVIHLSFQPMPDETMQVKWNGIDLLDDEWEFDTDRWNITVHSSIGMKADDEFEAKYLYSDPTPRPVTPGSAIFIAATTISNTATSVAIPPGTSAGDLLVLSIGTGGLAGTVPTVSDSRIVGHWVNGHFLVAWGWEDGSGDPLAINVSDGEANGRVVLASYSVTGDVTAQQSQGASNMHPTTPTGVFGAGIAVLTYNSGFLVVSPQDAWDADVQAAGSNTYDEAWSCLTDAPEFPIQSGTGVWNALIIGLAESV